MTATEAPRAKIARLEAELVRAQAAREDATSALHSLGLIVRAACASILAAAETLAPATSQSTGEVARLFADLVNGAQAATTDDAPRAPVLRLPMRDDKKSAAADAPATADQDTNPQKRAEP